jgi:hypothetical protein
MRRRLRSRFSPRITRVFWAWSFAALTAAAEPPDEFRSLVDRAGDARAEGDLDRALLLLERARAIKSVPELDNNIGRTLQDLGRYREAVEAYRRVVEDPRSGDVLRSLDEKRIEELRPKLERALVAVHVVPENAEVFVQGARVELRVGGETDEIAAPEGEVSIQATRAGGTVIFFVLRRLERGRLARVTLDVSDAPHRERTAAIDLATDMPASIAALSVDGTRIEGRLEDALELLLEPGPHALAVTLSGYGAETVSLEAEPGHAMLLATRLRGTRRARAREPQPSTSASKATRPPEVWPYVTAGVGAVLVGGGMLLLVSARADRNRVLDASRVGDVVFGVTMREAADLETSGNQKAAFGVVSIAIGVVTAAASLGWRLFTDLPQE